MNDQNQNSSKGLSYKDAGVDIAAGNQLVENIKAIAKRTKRPGVLEGLGGFGALFELPLEQYQRPVLVSGTDGVGTKLKLALRLKKHDGIGIDLVAMCVNDIITLGAEPLFFLDYYATGHLEIEVATQVIRGIGQGCEEAGAALVGGETAEMPSMYSGGDYDLAGFCVGIVEKHKIIDGSKVSAQDALIGIASSGPHANGYSLIRKVIETTNADLKTKLGERTLAETLLTPTKIYVKTLLKCFQKIEVHAVAHVTGGGLTENLPRVLPESLQARINTASWQWPEIFGWLQSQGNIAETEMYHTFNCGVGMVLCVANKDADICIKLLNEAGESAWQIGTIAEKSNDEPAIIFS